MDSLAGFVCYDEYAANALRQRGVAVETVSWRREGVDWNRHDAVIVRSTRDYQQAPAAFLDCLARIDASTAVLLNPLATMRANLDKRYLLELAAAGVPTVPTLVRTGFDPAALPAAREAFACDELIIKPCVSANADDTYRVADDAGPALLAELGRRFAARDHLLQPFVPSVLAEGEVSLFHFDRRYSHAIRKQPATGDFRVQEEHGGRITPLNAERELLAAADRVLGALSGELLYARTDFVRHDGRWCLMEAELIEPSLYFDQDPRAAGRFADALIELLGRG